MCGGRASRADQARSCTRTRCLFQVGRKRSERRFRRSRWREVERRPESRKLLHRRRNDFEIRRPGSVSRVDHRCRTRLGEPDTRDMHVIRGRGDHVAVHTDITRIGRPKDARRRRNEIVVSAKHVAEQVLSALLGLRCRRIERGLQRRCLRIKRGTRRRAFLVV